MKTTSQNVVMQYPTGAIVRGTVLDLFVLSLLDRGLETSYGLQRRGGLSVGSTVPGLKRLEAAGLVRKMGATTASKRPRYAYQLSAAGKKLARSGWKVHLGRPSDLDFDSVIRVADMARYYDASTSEIASFLDTASAKRRAPVRLRTLKSNEPSDRLEYLATQDAWNVFRLKAEANFLAGFATSLRAKKAKTPKR